MKTTIEIPENLLTQIKTLGAERGFSFRQFTIQALLDRLSRMRGENSTKPWMRSFGALRHLHQENMAMQQEIDREFSQVDPDEWK